MKNDKSKLNRRFSTRGTDIFFLFISGWWDERWDEIYTICMNMNNEHGINGMIEWNERWELFWWWFSKFEIYQRNFILSVGLVEIHQGLHLVIFIFLFLFFFIHTFNGNIENIGETFIYYYFGFFQLICRFCVWWFWKKVFVWVFFCFFQKKIGPISPKRFGWSNDQNQWDFLIVYLNDDFYVQNTYIHDTSIHVIYNIARINIREREKREG